MEQAKTVAFHTLGCKLNFSESSTLRRMLEQEGFAKRNFDDQADVYVINTCSVTDNADKECRQLVRRIRRRAPESVVVITGCYAQLKPEEIASLEGVDMVLGAGEKFNLAKHLRDFSRGNSALICSCDIDEVHTFHDALSQHDRTRTFLKVQDGCDYNCSFCTIPLARGKSRSDTIENVLNNAKMIAASGVKEIVLTGVNLGDFQYQNPLGEKRNFYHLIQTLDRVEGIERFRISSIEPNLLTKEIIDFVATSKKFVPHFHIPLQSGSDKILGLMRRRYRSALYAERVAQIKSSMPHCCIGVDVITGFPSESDSDFEDTYQFLHNLDVSYLHVFTYSERDNTHALTLKPIVPMRIRQERTRALRQLSHSKMLHFTKSHEGTTRPVLWEQAEKGGLMEGYTDNYIKVQAAYNADWVNKVIDYKL